MPCDCSVPSYTNRYFSAQLNGLQDCVVVVVFASMMVSSSSGRIEVHITHPADLAQRFAPSVAMLAENLSSVQMVAAAPTEMHSSKFIELPNIDS